MSDDLLELRARVQADVDEARDELFSELDAEFARHVAEVERVWRLPAAARARLIEVASEKLARAKTQLNALIDRQTEIGLATVELAVEEFTLH